MVITAPDAILDPMGSKQTLPDGYGVRPGRADDLRHLRPDLGMAILPAFDEPGRDELSVDDHACIVGSVEAAFGQALHDRHQSVLVGEYLGCACGFAIVDRSRTDPELRWIVVLPGHLGVGLAQALLAATVALCPAGAALSLIVGAGNRRAIRFFRRNRFVARHAGEGIRRILRMRRPAT